MLKQEAKDFRWRQMSREREKRNQLEPIYQKARQLLPELGISQQNLLYFASLVNFYTIHDLRNLKTEQTWLYMMCYIWLRYRQLSDNLTSAMMWHMKQTEERCKEEARKNFEADVLQRQQENNKVGRLLSLFVDDDVMDSIPLEMYARGPGKSCPGRYCRTPRSECGLNLPAGWPDNGRRLTLRLLIYDAIYARCFVL